MIGPLEAMNIDRSLKIFVAGHAGMVGSSIIRNLKLNGFTNIITRTRSEVDLVRQDQVERFFAQTKVDYVIIAAAKVGGINANNTYPADFIYENLMIQNNLIKGAYDAGIRHLLLLGSSCIYPKLADQPIIENCLLTGHLEPTNEPYAVAKIAGIKMCESYNRQHGTDYRSVMPTNLYGPGDNFDLETSHVIPGLVHKTHLAKLSESSSVEIWGSGNVHRDLLYVDDMAEASLLVAFSPLEVLTKVTSSMSSHINIGSGVEISIKELAKMVCKVIGYQGTLVFDQSMPDGSPRKFLNIDKARSLGWSPRVGLAEGLQRTYSSFLQSKGKG